MPELETEKAIAARVKQAIFFLEMGHPKKALAILKRLDATLPKPEERHLAAARYEVAHSRSEETVY